MDSETVADWSAKLLRDRESHAHQDSTRGGGDEAAQSDRGHLRGGASGGSASGVGAILSHVATGEAGEAAAAAAEAEAAAVAAGETE